MSQDELAIGMFEVGNCLLGGIGVKKAPDVALQYLRFAANLGDLAAQEREFISTGGVQSSCVVTPRAWIRVIQRLKWHQEGYEGSSEVV